MRAKPNLVPDCDIHAEPMYRDECPSSALGLESGRDMIIWRCARTGCGRYFHGTFGYRWINRTNSESPTPRCGREGAFLVAQHVRQSHVCPVDGCSTERPWESAEVTQEHLQRRVS